MLALLVLAALAAPPQATLTDPDPEVRLRALRDIDRARSAGALETVAALARDTDDAVQIAAIETLLNLALPERIAGRRRVALVVEVRRTIGAQGAFEADMVPAGPVPAGVFAPLAAALGDVHPAVRLNAAYAIGILAGPNAAIIPASTAPALAAGLAVMLTSPDPALRFAAARAAGRAFRAPTGMPIAAVPALDHALASGLIGLMNQTTDDEQSAAMQALGLTREAHGLQALADRFAYYRAEGPRALALTALEAIARIAHPASEDLVRRAAADAWASRDEDTALTVAFARERLLRDGSIGQIQAAVGRSRTRARAEAYLTELR